MKPDLYHAYIGVGQIGSFTESEKEAYHFILKTAKERNDKRAFKEIEKVTFDENYYKIINTEHSVLNTQISMKVA